MRKIVILICVLLVANVLHAIRPVKGNGNIIKQERQVLPFTEISAGGVFKLIISQADTTSITVETDENLMQFVTADVSGGVLKLSLKRATGSVTAMNVYISAPQLNALHLSGIAEAQFTTPIRTNRMFVDMSGVSKIPQMNLHSDDTRIRTSGTSKLKINAVTNALDAELSGVSSVNMKAKAGYVKFVCSGSARMSMDVISAGETQVRLGGACGVSGDLTAAGLMADVSGSSSLQLSGKWTRQKLTASGASRINLGNALCPDTEVSASGASGVSLGRTSINKMSRSGAASIRTSKTAKTPDDDSQMRDLVESLNKLSAELGTTSVELSSHLTDLSAEISSNINSADSDRSKDLQRLGAEFGELAKELGNKVENATININGKNYLLKDIKISTVNNSDGSVSLFINGEEVYKLK